MGYETKALGSEQRHRREAEVINRQVLWGRREKLRAGWKQRQEVEMLCSTGDEGAACQSVLYPCPHPQASALQVARVIVSTMSSAGVPKRTEQPAKLLPQSAR